MSNFVCIKVDREERPDLDDIYMAATVAMSGHGGWPMTVFLTPEQAPFFAGTYFPPKDAHGRPGFKTLLERLATLWKQDRSRLAEQARELTEHLQSQAKTDRPAAIRIQATDAAVRQLEADHDGTHGGFGSAPKFPPHQALSLLLRYHRRTGSESALRMATTTLDAMKRGGIYDHVGGGFARYSTDERWLVPHFEKMLYDNAQLARVYLEAYQATHDAEYRRVAVETLDYILHEMQSAEGGYCSATDADSEGVEGKFFVWTPDEIADVLDQPASEWFSTYYDITVGGNWEGVSIPNTPRPLEEVAASLGVSAAELAGGLEQARRKVYEARRRRVPPLLDDKVLASWNGLMIGAMAEGHRVFGDPRYLASAERAARYVLESMRRPDGGLYRTARAGKTHLDAYLEDYAFMADALIDLYEAGAGRWLKEALDLAERLIADFSDPEGGSFFFTAHGHEQLLVRSREGHDGAIPNANAAAASALARLSYHFDRADLRERAAAALRAYGKQVERAPRAFCTSLAVAELLLEGPLELVYVGSRSDERLESLVRRVAMRYIPNRVIAHVDPAEAPSVRSPLLEGKTLVGGAPALYVCEHFACKAPVTSPDEVDSALADMAQARQASGGSALSARRVTGAATAEATRELGESAAGADAYVPFGTTGLVASRVGFGGYRVDDRVTEHRAALALALGRGVNLIDTSTNYADGHSETMIGEVLAELSSEGAIRREQVIVVTKVGYVQGQNLTLAQEREQAGRAVPEMVKYEDGLWHCIHPEWLEDQLGRSLERLGLETVDVCLLHNPEYYLSSEHKSGTPLERAREDFYRRLAAAFGWFEQEVARGRLKYYGVSSNTAVSSTTDSDATDLERMLRAAEQAGGEGHHFRVLQVPMNLFESGAARERNTAGKTVLEFARERGIAVLVNRPLNAILDGRLLRLSEPPDIAQGPPLEKQLEQVRQLEQEFGRTLGPALRAPPGSRVRPADLARWGDQLTDLAARVDSYEQWTEVQEHAVVPQVAQAFLVLDRAFSGSPLAGAWEQWRERYGPALDALLEGVARRAADRSRARAGVVSRAIDPVLPEAWKTRPLSQKALGIVASAPGVTTVLVGMRSPDYVEDVLGMMGSPPLPDATAALTAAAQANVPGF